MRLCDVYLGLGEPALGDLLRSVSLGKLRTYQLFEPMKLRLGLTKLNSETLRRSAMRVWPRLQAGEEQLARELAQAILISHMDLIVDVLNSFGVPHEDGFFAKDLNAAQYFTDGWQQRAFEQFRGKYGDTVVLFYLNHLAADLQLTETVFAPVAA